MSGWMADMADAVDAHVSAQAPPTSKAAGPPSMQTVSIDDTPTEPSATSPRVMEVPINDGRWTQAEYAALVRSAAQSFNNRDIDQLRRWELEGAMQREPEAHERSVQEWERRIAARGIPDHSDLPRGPPPAGTSSMRALPQVHAALRQSDPSMAAHSQPVVKKAPPSTGRPMPPGFYVDKAQGLSLPLAATPMTPSHPPRPPIDALPKHPSMETGTGANKHPLEPPVQQGPPNKHVRPKAFPYAQAPPMETSMAAASAVDTSRPSTPCPKGPPAEYMPAPPEVTSMSTRASAVDQEQYVTKNGKIKKVRSVTYIQWNPLHEQLEPNLKGGPRSTTTPAELRMLRAQIPELPKHLFDGLFPAHNIITAVQKNHGVHKIHMSEVATWVLNATHWFSILDQPMMVIVWCHNWEDASKFQYLMQILQVHFGDYVPRYQIFMFDDSKIYGSIQQWQEPTTVWGDSGMANRFLDSWQRRFSMIYQRLASRISIQSGHFRQRL